MNSMDGGSDAIHSYIGCGWAGTKTEGTSTVVARRAVLVAAVSSPCARRPSEHALGRRGELQVLAATSATTSPCNLKQPGKCTRLLKVRGPSVRSEALTMYVCEYMIMY